ncbi:SCP2 domain-containing protein [Maricurvus nonylphenolicus]
MVGMAARHCPFSLQKKVMGKLLPQAFSEALRDGDLDFLQDRFVSLKIDDLKYRLTLTLTNNQLQIIPNTKPAEVTIGGNLDEFIRLAARKEDPDTLFFQRRLTIEGNTELGLEVKNLIDSIDIADLPNWIQRSLQYADLFIAKH